MFVRDPSYPLLRAINVCQASIQSLPGVGFLFCKLAVLFCGDDCWHSSRLVAELWIFDEHFAICDSDEQCEFKWAIFTPSENKICMGDNQNAVPRFFFLPIKMFGSGSQPLGHYH